MSVALISAVCTYACMVTKTRKVNKFNGYVHIYYALKIGVYA